MKWEFNFNMCIFYYFFIRTYFSDNKIRNSSKFPIIPMKCLLIALSDKNYWIPFHPPIPNPHAPTPHEYFLEKSFANRQWKPAVGVGAVRRRRGGEKSIRGYGATRGACLVAHWSGRRTELPSPPSQCVGLRCERRLHHISQRGSAAEKAPGLSNAHELVRIRWLRQQYVSQKKLNVDLFSTWTLCCFFTSFTLPVLFLWQLLGTGHVDVDWL